MLSKKSKKNQRKNLKYLEVMSCLAGEWVKMYKWIKTHKKVNSDNAAV